MPKLPNHVSFTQDQLKLACKAAFVEGFSYGSYAESRSYGESTYATKAWEQSNTLSAIEKNDQSYFGWPPI